jgi:hypothetical protein
MSEHGCPLLAQNGHWRVHCTCPLLTQSTCWTLSFPSSQVLTNGQFIALWTEPVDRFMAHNVEPPVHYVQALTRPTSRRL